MRPEPGKTKISIRLDDAVIEYFGNYQRSIKDALLAHIAARRSTW